MTTPLSAPAKGQMLGGFVMLFGAVMWMKDITPYLFFIGFIGVLYVMWAWWAEVIVESHQGDHTPVVQIGLRYGVIMFITSEVMFFSAWFWSFFKHAIYPMADVADKAAARVATADGFDGVWPLDRWRA